MTEFYELSKGDLFHLPGDTKVWKCAGVDGMYARVVERNESATDPRNYRYGISPTQEVIRVDGPRSGEVSKANGEGVINE